jgi:hypothetical protein
VTLNLHLIMDISDELSTKFLFLKLSVKYHQSLLHDNRPCTLEKTIERTVLGSHPYLATIKPRYKALARILGNEIT